GSEDNAVAETGMTAPMARVTDRGFKDHFSRQAAEYAKFRPRYPKELFRWLGSVAPSNQLAWDCATGSGQAAVELAEMFECVIGTDASEKQIGNAELHP